ncbi:MAG TPA: hypothetical protein RMG48_09190, partial [Myxococcales bacterium LLY-WYZ-16_1]|nr:hypothetical protein [Myxococcales bacterium LLY-WYZ-16_1]
REAVQARLQMAAERDVAMLHPDPPWARAAGWAATGLAVAAGLMAVTGAALEWAAGTAMVAALAWGVCRWLRRRADARRQSAVTDRVEAELESAVRAAQQAHDEAMRGWKARSEARRARWERLVRNEPDAVDDALEDAFAEIEFPFETSAEFDVQGERIDLAVDFPEIEDLVPETRPKALKKGGVRRVKRKRAERRHMYAESIAGLSVMLAATALSAAPGIRAVRLAGYTQRKRRGSSAVHDDFIVHAVFDRDALASIEPTTFDPLAFLEERPEAVAFDRWGKFRRLPRPDWISEVP